MLGWIRCLLDGSGGWIGALSRVAHQSVKIREKRHCSFAACSEYPPWFLWAAAQNSVPAPPRLSPGPVNTVGKRVGETCPTRSRRDLSNSACSPTSLQNNVQDLRDLTLQKGLFLPESALSLLFSYFRVDYFPVPTVHRATLGYELQPSWVGQLLVFTSLTPSHRSGSILIFSLLLPPFSFLSFTRQYKLPMNCEKAWVRNTSRTKG